METTTEPQEHFIARKDHPEVAAILEEIDGNRRPNWSAHSVVAVMGDIAVLKATHKPSFEDAQYTGSIKKDGKWRHTSRYNSSADTAMLDTLGVKHSGPNSQFGEFARKMLEI